jgi:hypothetical protein
VRVETAETVGRKSFEVEATSELVVSGHSFPFDNQSGLPDGVLLATAKVGPNPYIAEGASIREVAATLSRWVDNARAATGRTSMFDRGAYTPPDNPYDEMRAARTAMRYDSVVSGVAEITEAYAFQGVKWEGKDADEADVFNQLAADQNLDAFMRSAWREEFACGQFIAAKSWDWAEYTVRGETDKGNKRKRTFRVWAPTRLTTLDPTSVVPVGMSPISGFSLAWQAIQGELGYYNRAVQDPNLDPMMRTFFTGQYQPGYLESGILGRLGVDTSNLLMMNPEWVFRHTLTKADYDRFPDIRLKSVFRLLDLKQRLMDSDRAMLIGAANYILLVRKGLKDEPAQPEEMDALKGNFNFIAKLPVIISDHRLQIDIISPKTDHTLEATKYDTLDQRILSRLLGTLTFSHAGARSENQETLALSVARVMENRRHMMRRTLEREIARAIVRHPRNRGMFETEPNLVFTPRNIALAMDQQYIMGLLQLRTNREISRETILEYFGLDESTEAVRVQMEKDSGLDDIFGSLIAFSGAQPGQPSDPAVATPTQKTVEPAPAKKTTAPPAKKTAPAAKKTAAPAKKATPAKKAPAKRPESPRSAGQRGGRPVGGGRSPQSPQGQVKPRTRRGNPST